MKNLQNHLKNNIALYLIALTIIIILLAILLINRESEDANYVDTDMFIELDNKKALELFDKKENSVLVIGRKDCSATIAFAPTLQVSMAKYHFDVNYLELTDLDQDSEDYKKLKEKLDYDYTYEGKTRKFGEYMGITPMFIIIKNHRMVYGYLGSMSETVVKTMTEQYEVTQKVEN